MLLAFSKRRPSRSAPADAHGNDGHENPNLNNMTSLSTGFRLGLLCLVLMVGGFAEAQHEREDQQLPDELYALVDKRTNLIKQSIAKSSNEWPGTYLAGDHHPTVFMWTPVEGFLVTSSVHTFSPSWVNYGEVSMNRSMLTLRPVLTKDNNYAHEIDTEFRMVKWGDQHFLIPPGELKNFAYAVHSRAESEIVNYFRRGEDLNRTRRGLPDLPFEFTKYLKMKPIVALITAVRWQGGPAEEVTLSVGRRDSVIEGMVFYFTPRNGAQFSIRVAKVSETNSTGQVSSRATTGSGAGIKIRPGLRLTSRIPKGFIEPG